MRGQFCLVIALWQTFVHFTGVELRAELNGREQIPLHGKSIAYTWDEPDQPTKRSVQYFEQFGHRGLWKDGWKAVTLHAKGADFATEEWSLYNLEEAFS